MSTQVTSASEGVPGTSTSLDWNNTNHLVSTLYNDNKVRLWEVCGTTPQLALSYEHEKPVLDACFCPVGQQIISGGRDNKLLLFDIKSQCVQHLGENQQPVKTVTALRVPGLVATGGLDGIVNVWDFRAPPRPVYTFDLQSPVCTATHSSYNLFVATLDRKVHLLDFCKPDKRVINEALNSTIRCIAMVKSSKGEPLLGLGSHMGKLFFRDEIGRVRTFRPQLLQRSVGAAAGAQQVYQVNSICSDDTNRRFATGGDGKMLEVWKEDDSGQDDDTEFHAFRKMMIKTPHPITAVKFNIKGDLLAYSMTESNDNDSSQGQDKSSNCAVPSIHKVPPVKKRSPRRSN